MPEKPTQLVKQGSTVTVRQDLGEEIAVGLDMSPTAAAAAAKAEIEARIIHARKWPRDIDKFREGIRKDCLRPGFAETAIYRKPVGRKKNPQTGKFEEAFAEGFSVRFIESAIQHFQHCHTTARIGYEDAERALLTVQVIDVQRNVSHSADAMIDKLVERRELKAGRKARGMRENSYGDIVYLVEATKDEFRNLVAAERSKLLRDNGRRLLPPDILEECRGWIEATLNNKHANDPDAARKKILDGFAGLGISAGALKEYLGQPIESLSQNDLAELRRTYNGLKEGEFTWAEVIAPPETEQPAVPAEQRAPSKARDKVMQQASFLPEPHDAES